ncbi:MAG: DUF3795 domain-containing protein [Candidatus Bathyarchaeota archaeon]|nr:DUF3795 domain-containing protein [Candidatus Bathyarchaeota archaeon]
MVERKPFSNEPSKQNVPEFSDEELVAYCGINCKNCRERSRRRVELARLFKESLQELPLEFFSETFPPFKNIKQIMDFLEFLPQLGQMQTSCTSEKSPCGNPTCEIRNCVKEKGFRTCAECAEYVTCSKLRLIDLGPYHETLISDLDLIKEKGLEHYATEKVAKFKLEPIIID